MDDPKRTACELGAAGVQEAIDETQIRNKISVLGDHDFVFFQFGSFNSIGQNTQSTFHPTAGTSFFHYASPCCAYSCHRY